MMDTVLRDAPGRADTEIQTFTGRTVDLAAPATADIAIQDVAHGLAHTCRFGGQCSRFYSVAEHAVLCADLAKARGAGRDDVQAALHHDDHEAYIGDLPSPLKPILGAVWAALEAQWQAAIERALLIEPGGFLSETVRWADFTAVTIEGAELMPSAGWDWARADRFQLDIPWKGGLSPDDAKDLYLSRVETVG